MELTHKPPYSRRQLKRFLVELDLELARATSEKHTLTVIGGFVMAHCLYFRSTDDVDVVGDGLTPAVAQAAQSVAMRLGIAADWINAAARGIQIPVPQQLTPLFEGSVLTVLSPGLRNVLAMKLRAARDKDFSDCVALVRRLGIASESELHELLAQACGDPQNVTAERERFAADVLVRSRRWRRLACAVQKPHVWSRSGP